MQSWGLLSIAAAASAKTIYVDANSPGGGGCSWTDAYRYLQDALATAEFAAKPVEIRVAQGIYKPDEGTGVTDGARTETFQLVNGVALKGGYAGTGKADPNARDVDLYETILSGDLDGNDVNVVNPSDLLSASTRAENSYHVVTGSGTDKTAVLDGFTITAGNADTDDWDKGSGMYCSKGSPTVINCVFTNNSAGTSGGGMMIDNGIPTVVNCEFIRNTAGEKGGGIMTSMPYNDPSLLLTGCTFINNTANRRGGGICSKCTTTLIGCTFIRNSAISGYGGIAAGGGMYAEGPYYDPTLISCSFLENSAGKGGGMSATFVTSTLVNCIFAGNDASRHGGGVSWFVIEGQISSVTNCIFTGNTAERHGGGFYSNHDYTKFANCTFTHNHAGRGDGGGYCLDQNLGTADFDNCIFWGNTARDEGPQIAIATSNPTVITVNNSNIQGGELDVYIHNAPNTTLVWDDINNIDVDPMFVDADGADNIIGTQDDNLRLLPCSPCIDAGDNSAVPVDINDDLNGFPRFMDNLCTVDKGNGTVPIVDIGAYEYLRSDIDNDGDVDLVDFSQLALYWEAIDCGDCGGADLTCDGNVVGDDLKELAENWLKGAK